MKKHYKKFCSLGIVLILSTWVLGMCTTGCADKPVNSGTIAISTTPTKTNEQIVAEFKSNLKRFQPLIILGGNLVMKVAVSDKDAQDKLALLDAWGHAFQSLEGNSIITSDNLTTALGAFFPTSKAHWADLVTLSSSTWNAIYALIEVYIPKNYQLAIQLSNAALEFLAETAWKFTDQYKL